MTFHHHRANHLQSGYAVTTKQVGTMYLSFLRRAGVTVDLMAGIYYVQGIR